MCKHALANARSNAPNLDTGLHRRLLLDCWRGRGLYMSYGCYVTNWCASGKFSSQPLVPFWKGFVLLASHIHNFLAYGVTRHEGKAGCTCIGCLSGSVLTVGCNLLRILHFKLEVQIYCFFVVCGHSHCPSCMVFNSTCRLGFTQGSSLFCVAQFLPLSSLPSWSCLLPLLTLCKI